MTSAELLTKINKTVASKSAFDAKMTSIGINPPVKFSDYATRIAGFDGYDVEGTSTFAGIPNGVTSIRKYVLSGMTNVTSLTIPAAVTTFDANAFSESSLTQVTMTGRTRGQTVTIPNFAFGLGDTVTFHCTDGDFHGARYIAAGTTALPVNAFKDDANIVMGIIPSTVTSVGSGAYANCTSLEYVNFPTSVSSIGSGVFSNSNPEDIDMEGKTMNAVVGMSNFPFGMTDIDSIFHCTDGRAYCDSWKWGNADPQANPTMSGTTLVIGVTVGSISSNKYKGNTRIFNVTNNSICMTSIESGAFSGCSMITSFVDTVANDTHGRQDLYTIKSEAFLDCTSLETFTGTHVGRINGSAFKNCDVLKNVTLPNCTVIEGDAFYICPEIETLNLPEVTTIGMNSFYNCNKLSSLSLPKLTSVPGYAFEFCNSLTTLNLPSVTSISQYAFTNSSPLNSVTLTSLNQVPRLAFASAESLKTLTSTSGGISGVKESGLMNCGALTTITLPTDGKFFIENCGMEGCNSFTYDTLGQNTEVTMYGVNCICGMNSTSNSPITKIPNVTKAYTKGYIYSNQSFKGYIAYDYDCGGCGPLSTTKQNQVLNTVHVSNTILSGGGTSKSVNFEPVGATGVVAYVSCSHSQSAFGNSIVSMTVTDAGRWVVPVSFTLSISRGANKSMTVINKDAYGYKTYSATSSMVQYYTPQILNLYLDAATTINGGALQREKINNLYATAATSVKNNATSGATINNWYAYGNFLDGYEASSLTGVGHLITTLYTKTQVKKMANYPWGMASGSTITCTDGDITVGS